MLILNFVVVNPNPSLIGPIAHRVSGEDAITAIERAILGPNHGFKMHIVPDAPRAEPHNLEPCCRIQAIDAAGKVRMDVLALQV